MKSAFQSNETEIKVYKFCFFLFMFVVAESERDTFLWKMILCEMIDTFCNNEKLI